MSEVKSPLKEYILVQPRISRNLASLIDNMNSRALEGYRFVKFLEPAPAMYYVIMERDAVGNRLDG